MAILKPLNLISHLECCLTEEQLGEEIRRVWVELAEQEPNPKPAHLVSWADLNEKDKAIDRKIGQMLKQVILNNTVCNYCEREE